MMAMVLAIVLAAWGCTSSNCPLESTVTCNYGFYDSEGTAVNYMDTLTVRTLLNGTKTQYTYRKLGYSTVTSDVQDSALIEAGYSERVDIVRRDTILANSLVGVASMKIPMRYFASADTLVLSYASISGKDTIYIEHDSFSNIDLPECGTHRFHTLRTIRSTYAGIDHIEIVHPEVNYDGIENVRIYFNGTAD